MAEAEPGGKSPDPAPGTTTAAPSTPDGKPDTQAKVVFGKYEFDTPDAAAKQYEASIKGMNEAQREAAELRKQLAVLNEQAKMAEKLDRIAENTAPKPGPTPFEAWQEQLRQRYADNEDVLNPMLETTTVVGGWLSEARAETREALKMAKEALEARQALEQRLQELGTSQQKLRPDYAENRELVDKLTDGGLPFEKAIEFAKELRAQMQPGQPDRVTPPASVGGGRHAAVSDDKLSYFEPGERERRRAAGETDAELDALEATWKARVRAEGGAA